jgi:proline iminopeptidase
MLDQRGTGRSTPLFDRTILSLGSIDVQAEFLSHFRADSIVADAEMFRRHLIGPGGKWTVLGQSFGGFCALSYMSKAPDALDGVMFAGGLPPLGVAPDDVYRATYRRTLEANIKFFDFFSHARGELDRLLDVVAASDVRLSSGERLTVRRLLTVGQFLGIDGLADDVHDLVHDSLARTFRGRVPSAAFLARAGSMLSSAPNPLYPLLHELIYLEGEVSSRWSAHRVRAEFPQFSLDCRSPLFTGEMTYPWQFEEDPALRPIAPLADALASRDGWRPLYDRSQLAGNEVPAVAVVYSNDMYVDRGLSLATAASVPGIDVWETDEFGHAGLLVDPVVFDTLLELLSCRQSR